MGVKIFRDDSWHRITNGVISRKDIMNLDGEKDRELIGYLIAHAPKQCRSSVLEYAAKKYGMDEVPEPLINIDDPEDTFFWEYAVLREQVMREDDREVLRSAALNCSDYGAAAFAFCRLTGYGFPPGECDAYSYRTYRCGIMPGTASEMTTELCRRIIEGGGRFADVAGECLRNRKDTDQ